MRLTLREQVLLGLGVVLVLITGFVTAQSFLVSAALLALFAVVVVVGNPIAAILSFIGVSVFLSIRSKPTTTEAGGAIDAILGLLLISICAYWVIKFRLIERRTLNFSLAQLLLAMFLLWGILVTVFAVGANEADSTTGVRELLNLSPLFILPILYERFVETDSRAEHLIFAAIVCSGLVVLVANILMLKNHIAAAYYLFETGRGNLDIPLAPFMILIAASYLMYETRAWKAAFAIVFLLVESVGVVASVSRNMYIATPIVIAVVLLLGTPRERMRGMKRLLVAGAVGLLVAVPVYLRSRLVRLLIANYTRSFVSAQKASTDLSLLNRFAEWKGEWLGIQDSPIIGHGFGSQFRFFDIIQHHHHWSPFSHSSYLYIVYKTGFPGGLLFFAAFALFMIKGYRLARSRSLAPRTLITIRAGFGFMIIILFCAYLGPVFDTKTDMVWLGLVWGYFLAVERSERLSKSSSVSPHQSIEIATA